MIYLLSKDFQKSCTNLCDQHLKESIIDTGITVSYYLWVYESESVAFDAAHYFSPSRKIKTFNSAIPRALYPVRGPKDLKDWVLKSHSNYSYLIQYLIELTSEFLYRFSERHKYSHMIEFLPKARYEKHVDDIQIEQRIATCIDIYKSPRPVWKWTNREKPEYVL